MVLTKLVIFQGPTWTNSNAKAKIKFHEYRDDWVSLSHPEVTLTWVTLKYLGPHSICLAKDFGISMKIAFWMMTYSKACGMRPGNWWPQGSGCSRASHAWEMEQITASLHLKSLYGRIPLNPWIIVQCPSASVAQRTVEGTAFFKQKVSFWGLT